MDLSIVIPTWNGLALLRETLPSVCAAAEFYRRESHCRTEILVVDDGSEDETREVLTAEFPRVRLIESPSNRGFAPTCNLGFEHAGYPLVALLNNDVKVEPDYLLYQAPHFQDPEVLAVTARVFSWDGDEFTAGGRFGRFRRGFWSVYLNYDVDPDCAGAEIEDRRWLSAYAVGGFATYDRRKLRELGGFNTLLSPFHWEDVDLSYRGWKRGWKIHYEPNSVAYHRISATIGSRFRPRRVETVAVRNRLLFHWINLHSTGYWIRHLVGLAGLLLTRFLVLDGTFYRSFLGALSRISKVRRMRRRERDRARRSDAEISGILSSFYRTAPIRVYRSSNQVRAEHPGLEKAPAVEADSSRPGRFGCMI